MDTAVGFATVFLPVIFLIAGAAAVAGGVFRKRRKAYRLKSHFRDKRT
jgi:hypothetical protein